MNLNDKKDLLNRIRNGDEPVIDELYIQYRKPFMQWLFKKFGCSQDDAADIFQETIITFYDNVVSGKLTKLTSAVSTYVFSIGRNKAHEHLRREGKIPVSTDEQALRHLAVSEDTPDKAEKEKILLKVEEALNQLGEPCKSLLERFYYYKMSVKEIVERMDYKNESSARTAKYKCLQRLKSIVGEQNFEPGKDKAHGNQ